MSWSATRSEARIRKFLQTVPKNIVQVQSFDDRYSQLKARALASRDGRDPKPLVQIPPSHAIVVDGVHVYVQLTGYHSVLQDAQRQTEARHRRALEFLHTHYSACDLIIREYDAQRVDFHGSRLHAVIVTPPGPANERRRLERALEFAQAIARMVEATGEAVLNGEFKTETRIGIDTGRSIAVNSGRGAEPEPLFLGSPANYAAKLADGNEPGIYLSDRARQALGMLAAGSLFDQRRQIYNQRHGVVSAAGTLGSSYITDARIKSLSADVGRDLEVLFREANFIFHRHTPPLRTIEYERLSPANSIHMPLVSIFADIDGFTKYVDYCLRTNQIPELVSNLHAIRLELAAVLKHDFDGRKVRFIGDCLHGLLAEGTAYETDERETVRRSVICAAAMRSSFDLCRAILPGIANLGIAIGIELGPAPITRLGIRGEFSVRCATSKAVSDSEELQADCEGDQTALGPRAFAAAPLAIQRLFDATTGRARGLDYADASERLSLDSSRAAALAAPAAIGTSAGWTTRAAASESAIQNSGGNRHA